MPCTPRRRLHARAVMHAKCHTRYVTLGTASGQATHREGRALVPGACRRAVVSDRPDARVTSQRRWKGATGKCDITPPGCQSRQRARSCAAVGSGSTTNDSPPFPKDRSRPSGPGAVTRAPTPSTRRPRPTRLPANLGRPPRHRPRGRSRGGQDSPAVRASRSPLTHDGGRRVLAGMLRALPDLPRGGAAGSDPRDAHAFLHLRPVGDSKCTAETALGDPGDRWLREHGGLNCTPLPGSWKRVLTACQPTCARAFQPSCPIPQLLPPAQSRTDSRRHQGHNKPEMLS